MAKHGRVWLGCPADEPVTSAALEQLVRLDRHVRQLGGSLSLFSLNAPATAAVAAARLTDVLDVHGIPLPPHADNTH